jgi:molybdenum cofactor synthesis domain-containing protein
VSEQVGIPKTPVDSIELVAGQGLAGDAHAGDWHRQVSLLDYADFSNMQQRMGDLHFGAFAENLIIEGIDFSVMGLGSCLRLGRDAEIRISQIGKDCHTPCAIYHSTGDCIMPRAGLFARVVKGGKIALGNPVEVIELVERERFQAVILTVSDRCSGGLTTDTAGPAAGKFLEDNLRAHIYRIEVIPDEIEAISSLLKHYCDGHSIDLVITVGGTGFAPRDVTPEATRLVIERFTPGLDEAMRMTSLSKTPYAILSRGLSGIRGGTLIVNVPGSQPAACECLEVILPTLEHGLHKLRGDSTDCGRQGE